MKFRFGLYIFALAVCVFLVLWHRKNNTRPEGQSVQAANLVLSTNTNIEKQPAQPSNQKPIPYAQTSSNVIQNNSQSRVDMIKEALEQKNVPVNFYGRVIDQDSNALSEVNIHIYVRHWGLTENAMSQPIRLERETDAGGRFEISGETGDALDFESIQKTGYDLEPGQRSFGAVGGSMENPVIFKMWGTNIHEQLITGEKKFQIVSDGRPYSIDLTSGTIAESGQGDFKVWIKRPDQIIYGKRYDWSGEIDAINGGLLEEDNLNSAMFSAPTEGYVKSFSYEGDASVNGWGDSTGTKRFYVMLKNGQEYGRISIELNAYYNNQIPALIQIQYVINSSGSHI